MSDCTNVCEPEFWGENSWWSWTEGWLFMQGGVVDGRTLVHARDDAECG